MMGIWSLITKNLMQRAHTRRPESVVAYPSGFRGELLHDTDQCTACGTCAYVCSPSAITFDKTSPEQVTWQYQMMGCTYCGRCVEFCPTHALSFEQCPAGPLFQMELTEHAIRYQPCSRCGEGMIPLPHALLEEQYGSPVPAEMLLLNGMCERCRKKVYSANIKRGFTG